MTATVSTLPIWKAGATAEERLQELAMLAREHPEHFEHFIIIYRGTDTNGNWRVRGHSFALDAKDNNPALDRNVGLLELGKMKYYEDSAK